MRHLSQRIRADGAVLLPVLYRQAGVALTWLRSAHPCPRVPRSHAAGRLRQSRDLACALGRARREQLVDRSQVSTRVPAQLADHRGDAELEIVVADVLDDLPVILR